MMATRCPWWSLFAFLGVVFHKRRARPYKLPCLLLVSEQCGKCAESVATLAC